MWAENIPMEWIEAALRQAKKYPNNTYLYQSKNPSAFLPYFECFIENTHLGTTIESNRVYPCMGKTPSPGNIEMAMNNLKYNNEYFEYKLFVTIEPILDFDLEQFTEMLKYAKPDYINIGADSGNNHLPEPEPEKIRELINALETFTEVHLKKNLKRLLQEIV
jgi:hypothetical protein